MTIETEGITPQETTTTTPKCPYCEADLRIGYTEHGTKVWNGKEWDDIGEGDDAQYYCLACYADLDYEDLEKLDVF